MMTRFLERRDLSIGIKPEPGLGSECCEADCAVPVTPIRVGVPGQGPDDKSEQGRGAGEVPRRGESALLDAETA